MELLPQRSLVNETTTEVVITETDSGHAEPIEIEDEKPTPAYHLQQERRHNILTGKRIKQYHKRRV
jgi:hypothetical protein